ncbi:cytosolic 5'-nucleotidase 1B [Petaurus breviceps papuanus]|uniref:cytosolic 5'-nucleotidase 1B n=1 Tax=Petaurus breviceps papuanus TaxID=3040969 RepID=UPI0036DC056A
MENDGQKFTEENQVLYKCCFVLLGPWDLWPQLPPLLKEGAVPGHPSGLGALQSKVTKAVSRPENGAPGWAHSTEWFSLLKDVRGLVLIASLGWTTSCLNRINFICLSFFHVKSEGAMKVPRENNDLDRKSMRDVERTSTRQSAQMRRAVNPIHSLRRCSMWCFSSYRRCLGLGAVEGALLLGPFRSLTVYLYMCLLWEQGQQAIIIRSITQEYVMLKNDSQRSLRQGRNSRVSVSEDTKGRNQSSINVNSRVSIVEPGEKLPHSTLSAVQTPEKAPSPPQEPEQPPTPPLIPPPPPAPPPPSSPASEVFKARSSQEWKSSKSSLTQSLSEDTDGDVSNWTPGRPRPPKPKNAITIAVSSRALFNMVEDSKIFENEGLEKYMAYQITNENVILSPGPAFGFVKALQNVNARLHSLYPSEQDLFDIVLMTNNHAQVGVRLINSINHYGLLIDRFCLTGGENPIGYLKTYLTNLYLSADSDKVQEAIKEGIAAATMYLGNKDLPFSDTQLRVAFDGDALLFSDDFDQNVNEKEPDKPTPQEPFSKDKLLAQGPLKQFLEDLGRLQKKFYAKDERLLCPIRTYLITARSAASSGARVLKTLRAWGLEIDEALFLAGAPKGPILVKIRPHIFFDDSMFHTKEMQKFGTIVASVPFPSPNRGSLNQESEKK